MTNVEVWTLRIDAVKAAGDVLIPVVLAIGGAVLYRRKTAIDAQEQINRDAIARRSLRLEPLCGIANDIYCFTMLVGNYRSISPIVALEKKRQFEAQLFATIVMWDDESLTAAKKFIEACYITKQGPGTSARLASDLDRQRKERSQDWNDAWTSLFLPKEERAAWITEHFGKVDSFRNDVVKPRYALLLSAMSRSAGGSLSTKAIEDILAFG